MMTGELARKCNSIIQNFGALKMMSLFGEKRIVACLRKEIKDLSLRALKDACEYIRQNLSPSDYELFSDYIRKAGER